MTSDQAGSDIQCVGERGPELFIPDAEGCIVTSRQSRPPPAKKDPRLPGPSIGALVLLYVLFMLAVILFTAGVSLVL